MIGYILWTTGIIAVIAAWFALVVWMIEGGGFVAAAGVVLGLAGLGLGMGLLFYAIAEGDKPAAGLVKWQGGDGPRTVCWYADEDDPDTVISTGKTVVVVPSDSATRYTYCSSDGKNIPKEASE